MIKKPILASLAVLGLAGCESLPLSEVPDTFVSGVADAAKWALELIYNLFVAWWQGIF